MGSVVHNLVISYSPKGMDTSARAVQQRTTLGRGPIPFAPSLKGMNTPRRLLSIPFRKWEVAIWLSQGSGWAATLIGIQSTISAN